MLNEYRLSYYVSLRSDFRVVMSVTISFFAASCLWDCSCLVYVIFGCLHIMMSNAYCVVFLLCFSSSCVHCGDSFSGFSILDCPFGVL